jgi:4'-phosphopantetheinyl transferase
MPELHLQKMDDGLRWCLWGLDDQPELESTSIPEGLFEQNKFEKISHPEIAKQYLGARMALQRVLPKGTPRLSSLPSGKPILNREGHVSLTHTIGRAAAVFHPTRMCGIDIEDVDRRFNERVIKRFTHPSEMPLIEAHGAAFLWCAKEAVYKAQGQQGLHFAEDIIVSKQSLDFWEARVCQKEVYKIFNQNLFSTVISIAIKK